MFRSPKRPDRLWGPLNFLFNATGDTSWVKPQGREAKLSPLYNIEFNSGWSYAIPSRHFFLNTGKKLSFIFTSRAVPHRAGTESR
jgi:hypothetical protein